MKPSQSPNQSYSFFSDFLISICTLVFHVKFLSLPPSRCDEMELLRNQAEKVAHCTSSEWEMIEINKHLVEWQWKKWKNSGRGGGGNCPIATLWTQNSTWTDLGLNLGHLNYGMAFCVTYSCTLKMEAADSSKMLVPIYQITQCYISDDSNVCIHCRENLKSLSVDSCVPGNI
jgi:hypothetical protein